MNFADLPQPCKDRMSGSDTLHFLDREICRKKTMPFTQTGMYNRKMRIQRRKNPQIAYKNDDGL